MTNDTISVCSFVSWLNLASYVHSLVKESLEACAIFRGRDEDTALLDLMLPELAWLLFLLFADY